MLLLPSLFPISPLFPLPLPLFILLSSSPLFFPNILLLSFSFSLFLPFPHPPPSTSLYSPSIPSLSFPPNHRHILAQRQKVTRRKLCDNCPFNLFSIPKVFDGQICVFNG